MFTTPCFIRKNTAELRRKLESLGYRKGGYPLPVGREDVYDRDIHLYENSYHFRDSTLYGITNNIDCGTNEDLFLALAAMRDDSDYMQWFTDGEKWFQNKQNDIEVIHYGAGNPINFHKATVEELIEHFKEE